MNSIKIELPVLVQNIEVEGVKQYYLKPLFLPHPIATHRRYERAVAKFQNELHQMFKGFIASRENIEDLLWYRFNPKVEYKVYSMEFLMSKTHIKGDFGVAHFMLNDLCFVCLPSFNNYFFIANKDHKGKYNIAAEAARVIQHFLREERKSEGYVHPQNYYASKGEFVSYVSVYVQISDGKFGFEEDASSFFFSSFSNETDFNGEIEMEKVGYDLNAKYPSEIKRAYYRDETVQRISNIIYSQDNSPIVIVGRDGVGKHSVLQEAVYQYVDLYSMKIKHTNQLEKVWHIDPTRLISGMSIVGMWQKRFESILNFVLNRRKEEKFRKDHTDKIVIDNVVSMLRIGKSAQNDMTLSDVIKPYLEQRQIQFILIATPDEWKVLQEKDRRFADLFQVIRIEEPDLETAAKMVFKQRIQLEIEHACQIISKVRHCPAV
jgi:ATP-dependent Clp protease ATP-binding subunit ClpC